MSCNPCPPDPCSCIDPCEDNGCSSNTLLKCSHFSGDDIECEVLSITKADTGDEVIKKLADAICSIKEDIDTPEDKYVKISSNDSTSGYLEDKLEEGVGINITKINSGLNEKLRITVDTAELFDNEETPLTATDTNTIDFTATGPKGHNLTADVKIDTTQTNILTSSINGLRVAPNTPLTVNDSTSIDFTANGTNNHTLTGVVKVSSTAGNSLSINSTGLYVPTSTQAPITSTDSSTIDFTTSGQNITGIVKLSATSGNSLVDDSGLFVPTLTSNNGLTKTSNNFELGGALIKNTTLSGNFDLSLNQGRLNVGTSSSAGKLTVVQGGYGKAIRSELTESVDAASEMIATQSQVIVVGGTNIRTSQNHIAGTHSSLVLLSSGNQTFNAGIISGIYSELALSVQGGATVSGIMSSNTSTITITNNSTYEEVNNFRVVSPSSSVYNPVTTLFTGSIQNYAGVKIEPSDAHANLQTTVVNRFGIKQEGVNDKNSFAGNTYIGGAALTLPYKLNVEGDVKLKGRVVNTPQTLSNGNWNLALGTNAKLTLTANTALIVTGLAAGTYFTLLCIQDAVGGRTISLPSGSKVMNGGLGGVTLSTAALSRDILCGYYDGEYIYWTFKKNYN